METEPTTRFSGAPILRPRTEGYAPGTLLADRYRIVSLVGRGGMGAVYRADDLRLGQPVALKFLPAYLEHDPAARAAARRGPQRAQPSHIRTSAASTTSATWMDAPS